MQSTGELSAVVQKLIVLDFGNEPRPGDWQEQINDRQDYKPLVIRLVDKIADWRNGHRQMPPIRAFSKNNSGRETYRGFFVYIHNNLT